MESRTDINKQEKSKTLSVVIPVYNPPLGLFKECIESVIKTNCDDIEIIIIDDGTTDKEAITTIQDIIRSDRRIKYCYQENGGVGSARNLGISIATGKYIVFIDSDDAINVEKFEALVQKLAKSQQYELIITNHYRGDKETHISTGDISSEKVIRQMLCNRIPSGPISKIYNKKLIDDNKIRFNTEMKVGEDLIFNYDYLMIIKNVTKLSFPYYIHHFDNTDSATHRNSGRDDVLKGLLAIYDDSKYKKEIAARFVYEAVRIPNGISDEYRAQLKEKGWYKKFLFGSGFDTRAKISTTLRYLKIKS